MRCLTQLRAVTVAALLICLGVGALAQQPEKESARGRRASSQVPLGKECSLQYAGAFLADGSFKGRSRLRLGELVDTVAGQPEDANTTSSGAPADDVSPAKQRVVEDYSPGAHPVETVQGRPVLADVVDAITSFAAEHQAVMEAPRSLATDSRGRLLVADPPAHAVHVLDFKGKTSFRIQGGPDRRLQKPVAVDVDGQDNIYVSDAERGMVLVYDQFGRFRHYIGKIKGEAFFDRPEGVAIDRRAGRMYVADTGNNSVVELDLHGQVVAIFGRRARGATNGEFSGPTSLVLLRDQLFVLDSFGSRVQVLDLQGNLRRQISTPNDNASPPDHAGLAIDGAGNIYVSDEVKNLVRVYGQEGRMLSAFGRAGGKIGEFSRPLGLWADGGGRIYVADSNNHRVQVFQFRANGHRASCQ